MTKKLSSAEQAIISASDAGHPSTTAELASRLLDQQPDNLRILIEYGHACLLLGRYRDGETAFEKAILLCEPEKRDVIYGEMGNLQRSQANFDQAAQWYQKQIETDPSDATGYLFWGAMLVQLGEQAKAAEILQRGLDCRIGCLEELHYTLGLALRGLRRYREATTHFQKACDIDPNYLVARNALKDAPIGGFVLLELLEFGIGRLIALEIGDSHSLLSESALDQSSNQRSRVAILPSGAWPSFNR